MCAHQFPYEIRGTARLFYFPRWVRVTILLRPNGGKFPTLQIHRERTHIKDHIYLPRSKLKTYRGVFIKKRGFKLTNSTRKLKFKFSTSEACQFWVDWFRRVGVLEHKRENRSILWFRNRR